MTGRGWNNRMSRAGSTPVRPEIARRGEPVPNVETKAKLKSWPDTQISRILIGNHVQRGWAGSLRPSKCQFIVPRKAEDQIRTGRKTSARSSCCISAMTNHSLSWYWIQRATHPDCDGPQPCHRRAHFALWHSDYGIGETGRVCRRS